MTSENNTTADIVNTLVDGLDAVGEVTKSPSIAAIANLTKSIRELLGKNKEKVQTHLYLEKLQNKIENKGDGNIHIPKVSKLKRDAEYIHIPEVMQSVINLVTSIIPGTTEIIHTTNALINMLIGEDVKGVGYFLTQEAQQVIKQNSYEDLLIARIAIQEDLDALRSIEKNNDKWEDKMKLSILYTAFDRAIFEQNSETDNTERFDKKSDLDKKLEYLESTLQPGDILYLNPPNKTKSLLQNAVTNIAKYSMIEGKNAKDFTSIHAAVYVGKNENGEGQIRHIHRGNNGEISEKEQSVRNFFTENNESDTLYASIAIGRLQLSESVQNIFAKIVIEKSNTVTGYSELEAANAGLHGIGYSSTDINTDDTNIICTDLPRMSAKIILENLDENNTLTLNKLGNIVRKDKKKEVNLNIKEDNKNEEGEELNRESPISREIATRTARENNETLEHHELIKLSNSDINELKKLVNSNGTFQMFTKFASPIAMNIKDFTIDETTAKIAENKTKYIPQGEVSETKEIK